MASILGVSLLANDIAKDMDTVNGELVAREGGRVVATQQKMTELSLLDYYYMPMSLLHSTEKVLFKSELGEHMLKVSKIDKNRTAVVFHGFNGDFLSVERGTVLYKTS